MLNRLAIAATAAALLAPSSVAHAATVRAGCAVAAFAQRAVTGAWDTYVGFAAGHATFDDTQTHAVRCYIKVDGFEVVGTYPMSGVGAVATEGQVTFEAEAHEFYSPEPDSPWVVLLCLEIDGVEVRCRMGLLYQAPPQEILDIVMDVGVHGSVDPLVCPVLASQSTAGRPVDIAPDGDTEIARQPVWDCPPDGEGEDEGDPINRRSGYLHVNTVTYPG